MRLIWCFSLCLLSLPLFSQNLQPLPITHWKLAGLNQPVHRPTQVLDVTQLGAIPNDQLDDTPAIQAGILQLNQRAGTLYFPPGTYVLTQTLDLPDSCVLRGAGYQLSRLEFDLPGGHQKPCIRIAGTAEETYYPLKVPASQGRTQLSLATSSPIQAENYVELRQKNGDWDARPADWATHSVGQILRVQSVSAETIRFSPELRTHYSTSLQSEVRPIQPVVGVGIERLAIHRKPSTGSGANIHFQLASDCWMKGVESDYSGGSHVMIEQSTDIEITGNYIHGAHYYDGSATRGYGVTLRQHSGQILVENNIFHDLRHAIVLKEGANGNVIAYNYSFAPHRTESPQDLSSDINLHGHYAFSNLIEGNIAQNIAVDHFWGPSGPYNTFFRNRAESYGISTFNFQAGVPGTEQQYLIGNEITSQEAFKGNFFTHISDYLYGNNVKGEAVPEATETLGLSSLYQTGPPDYWQSNLAWPAIGYPNSLDSERIPALNRFLQQDSLAICLCDPIQEVSTHTTSNLNSSWKVVSPFTHNLTLLDLPHALKGHALTLSLSHLNGQVLTSWRLAPHVSPDTQVLKVPPFVLPGVYLLAISTGKETYYQKVVKAPGE